MLYSEVAVSMCTETAVLFAVFLHKVPCRFQNVTVLNIAQVLPCSIRKFQNEATSLWSGEIEAVGISGLPEYEDGLKDEKPLFVLLLSFIWRL